MSFKFNPFSNKLDRTENLLEAIAHADLSDMPDTVGTNTDHDTVYLKLDGSNANTTINIGSEDLTTLGTISGGTLTDGTASLTSGSLTSVKLGSLTSNGFVKTSGGDGTLSVDTEVYAPDDQTMYIGTTGVAINRGSGALTLAGLTLTTPDIGTPSAGVLTNCTGLPAAAVVAGTLGTGAYVFDNTVSGITTLTASDIVLSGASILANATASGVLTLGGTGGSENENITFDFESVENQITLGSSTGVQYLKFGPFNTYYADDKDLTFGNDYEATFEWSTDGTNHQFNLGLDVGNAAYSGYFCLMERADLGNANRQVAATTANPTLRIYSADATQASDYIEFFHDQSDAKVYIKQGALWLYAEAGNMNMNSDYGNIDFCSYYTPRASWKINTDHDEFRCGVDDEVGNMFILTNRDNAAKDHDHTACTNPTLFIHSDKDPDTANDEWISFTHDVTNAVFGLGSGAYTFPDGDMTVTGTIGGTTITGANVTTGADPGHTHTAYETAGAVTTHESTYNHANYNTAYGWGDHASGGYAQVDQTMYIGTTAVAINRTSAALTLAGITLTTPDIGTPSAGVLTNCTGLPAAAVVAGTFPAGNFLFTDNLDIGDHLAVGANGAIDALRVIDIDETITIAVAGHGYGIYNDVGFYDGGGYNNNFYGQYNNIVYSSFDSAFLTSGYAGYFKNDTTESTSINEGSTYGLYTEAIAVDSGITYGIYAKASGGGTNWAGYFEGKVHTTDDLVVNGGQIGITADLDLISMASGALTINGTTNVTGNFTCGAYLVSNNDYAFQAASYTSAGLYFNASSTRYEFRTTNGSATAYITLAGAGYFTGAVTWLGGSSTAANDHIADNSQAHSDYLLNTTDSLTGDLTVTGNITANGANSTINVDGAMMGDWAGGSAYAAWAHSSMFATSTSYALIQQDDGDTFLNAASGKLLSLRIANSNVLAFDATNTTHYNHQLFAVTNTYDIGTAANELRSLYVGTNVDFGTNYLNDARVGYINSCCISTNAVTATSALRIPAANAAPSTNEFWFDMPACTGRLNYNDGSGTFTWNADSYAASNSCPYLYVWDGEMFNLENDMYPYNEDVDNRITDFIVVHNDIKTHDGEYIFKIMENDADEERSHTYYTGLMCIDHPEGYEIATTQHGVPHMFKDPLKPTSVETNLGYDVTSKVVDRVDEYNYIVTHPDDYFDWFQPEEIEFLNVFFDHKGKGKLLVSGDKCSYAVFVNGKELEEVGLHEAWMINVIEIPEDFNGHIVIRRRKENPKISYIGLDVSEDDLSITKMEVKSAPSPLDLGSDLAHRLRDKDDGKFVKQDRGHYFFVKFDVPEMKNTQRSFIFEVNGWYESAIENKYGELIASRRLKR